MPPGMNSQSHAPAPAVSVGIVYTFWILAEASFQKISKKQGLAYIGIELASL
jgi:hypothetical protein